MNLFRRIHFGCILFVSFFVPSACFADIKCLDAEGEAVIVNNDIPSAKAEAISRAKWAAIEQAVGVDVKAQSVVQNMMMVDEAISRQIQGAVTKHKVLQVSNGQDVVSVKINACVEPDTACDAVAGLALNNSVAVFIPARKPGNSGTSAEYEESNIFSESLIGKLTDQGYTVVDVAPTHALEVAEMEKALKSGNYLSMRSLSYKFLANVLLIGKIDYTISTRQGEDVGYGLAMPFNNVTARLTYRLVTRDASGNMLVLAAGAEHGKGMSGNLEDAVSAGLKDLSEKLAPVIADKVGQHVKASVRRVTVKVTGITELGANFAVKEALQNMAWVTEVEEKGLGEFVVSYSENPVYLANSIQQKSFTVESFSPSSITIGMHR